MKSKRDILEWLILLAGCMVMLLAAACVQPKQPAFDDTRTASSESAVVAEQVPQDVKNGEKDYYVDREGALHEVTRRLVRSEGGLYSIVDDDGEGQVLEKDKKGRLFYRDSSGAIHYVKEVRPGVAVEKQPAPAKRESQRPAKARKNESCESQWRECVSGCNAISPRQANDRPDCLNECEYIRRHCVDRQHP